ncbi:5431_t:CDS:2, partial [Scutellospora calospora]
MVDNLEASSEDLANSIRGLYRLLDLCKDEGSNGRVDKIIISTESLKRLCNDLKNDSFNQDFLIHSDSSDADHRGKPVLRPGIYLLKVDDNLGLVIHWPEHGCYEENISSHKKKNMINLHSSDEESEGTHFEFEVTKDQEEKEDFIFYPGFKMKKISTVFNPFTFYIITYSYCYIESTFNQEFIICIQVVVIESASHQAFVTMKKVQANSKMKPYNHENFSPMLFNQKLEGHTLRINKEITMDSLKILIKHGFPELENEILTPLNKALDDEKANLENKKEHETQIAQKNSEIATAMFWNELKKTY